MEAIRIRGGHRFRIKHGPAADKSPLNAPETVGVSPRGVTGLKPKVVVKEGDKVERGQLLFHDKRREHIRFTSPAGGTVKEIRYGARRSLEAVVIALDETNEPTKSFGATERSALPGFGRDAVIERLVESGLWSRLISFPGWTVAPLPGEKLPPANEHAEPEDAPSVRSLYVAALATEPHQPEPAVAMEGNEELFAAGLEVLRQIPTKNTFVMTSKGGKKLPSEAVGVTGVQQRVLDDKYPAENVGLHVYYTEHLGKKEVAVGVSLEDVIDIGHLFLKGTLRAQRTYAVAGNAAKDKKHFTARAGLCVKDLVGALPSDTEVRLIAGGLFTGRKVSAEDFLTASERSVQVMVEDRRRIPFAFQARLGFDKLTLNRVWGAAFFPGEEREASTSNFGEERACVQCGHCIDVCPIELMPNLVFKAALEKDIEKMEKLFIRDCVDCGLCTFVCPSKIELGQHIEDGKSLIAKEG